MAEVHTLKVCVQRSVFPRCAEAVQWFAIYHGSGGEARMVREMGHWKELGALIQRHGVGFAVRMAKKGMIAYNKQ